jgi:hypothetical protein
LREQSEQLPRALCHDEEDFSVGGGGETAAIHMVRFVTRVQLNGYPSAEQYEKLHKEMKRRGFTRVIESSEAKYYWLPHREYYRETNASGDQVLADARAAAAAVSKDYEVLASETTSSTWWNLKPATRADAVAA